MEEETPITTLEEALKRNTAEYQHHLAVRNRINKALQHQHNIRNFQTIPKRHLPPSTLELTIPNQDIKQQFETEYHQLFFRHLNRVITHNTITLELENARLKELIDRTENQLTATQAPKHIITQLRQQFYRKNNIPHTQQATHATGLQPSVEPTPTVSSSRPAPPSSASPDPTTAAPASSANMHQTQDSQQNYRKPRKRKISSHPNPQKIKKINHHFLSQGHHQKPPT